MAASEVASGGAAMSGSSHSLITHKRFESWSGLYQRQQDALIDLLDLDDSQKLILHYRWLGAIGRIEQAAGSSKRKHNGLRMFAICVGAVVSGLVGIGVAVPTADKSLNLASVGTSQILSGAALVASLTVSVALAVDAYFKFGDRYRESRVVAETLRIEGSRFVSLADRYSKFASHRAAFQTFMTRVEAILEHDIAAWVSFSEEAPKPGPASQTAPGMPPASAPATAQSAASTTPPAAPPAAAPTTGPVAAVVAPVAPAHDGTGTPSSDAPDR